MPSKLPIVTSKSRSSFFFTRRVYHGRCFYHIETSYHIEASWSKSMNWFLYDRLLRHERVKQQRHPPTWKQINIYQKYASPVPAFSQSTICWLTKKKWKFSIRPIFLMWTWNYKVKIGFLRGFKTKIIKYKMQKVVK